MYAPVSKPCTPTKNCSKPGLILHHLAPIGSTYVMISQWSSHLLSKSTNAYSVATQLAKERHLI